MAQSLQLRFFSIAGICLVLGAFGGALTSRLLEERHLEPVRFAPPQKQAAGFRLRDQDGRWVTLRTARGHVLVLTFLYSTCRDLCPAQAAKIKQAVLEVGKGVDVFGVSVDPVGDTPERARAFLKRYGLYGGPVRFLVGSRRQLRPVWAEYGIVPIAATREEAAAAAAAYDRQRGEQPTAEERRARRRELAARAAPRAAEEQFPNVRDLRYRGRARHAAGEEFEHSAYVLLIDKHGRQRVGFPFEQLKPQLLVRDMRSLLAEP